VDERTEPMAAIIVLNWNGLTDTEECLGSLEDLVYRNKAIVVVDNGSEGNDVEIIMESYGDRISLIRNDNNLGYAAGNNVGIKRALSSFDPDYLLLLNNDTIVDPGFLGELIALAESDAHIGLVGPKTYYYDRPDVIQRTTNRIDLYRGKVRFIGDKKPDCSRYDRAAETDYVEGSCMLIKREVIEKIGFLDEAFFCYWEDMDYCMRAREAGYISAYCPTARIWHKGSRSAATVSGLDLYYGTRNRFFVLRIHAGKAQYLTFLFYYFAVQFWLAAVKHLLIRRDPSGFASLLRGVKDGVLLPSPSSAATTRRP
jgi:GT2 family glycosyltransferase